jgi:hypothetical protein
MELVEISYEFNQDKNNHSFKQCLIQIDHELDS